MLKNLYVLIIIIPLVQISMCKTPGNTNLFDKRQRSTRCNALETASSPSGLKHINPIINHSNINKKSAKLKPVLISASARNQNSEMSNKKHKLFDTEQLRAQTDLRYFDSVVEPNTHASTAMHTNSIFVTTMVTTEKSPYEAIKSLLAKVVEQIAEIEKKRVRDEPEVNKDRERELNLLKTFTHESTTDFSDDILTPTVKDLLGNSPDFKKVPLKKKKENTSNSDDKEGNDKRAPNPSIKWGHWTDWSSCSVSCGKGRQIRWRHCVEHCDEAETEMEEKTCQLPACAPGKLFGFKI